jgi:hypothetical protein
MTEKEREKIELLVFTIQKLTYFSDGNSYELSYDFKEATTDEINRLKAELASYSSTELADFIVNFEGF